jgi:hypothetical protein
MKKMPKKRHLLYYRSTFAIFAFFIILALNMRVLWMSAILVFVFGSGSLYQSTGNIIMGNLVRRKRSE